MCSGGEERAGLDSGVLCHAEPGACAASGMVCHYSGQPYPYPQP